MVISHYFVSIVGLVGYLVGIVGLTLAASGILDTQARRRWFAGIAMALTPLTFVGSFCGAALIMFPSYRITSATTLEMMGIGIGAFATGYYWAGHAERGPLIPTGFAVRLMLCLLFWGFIAISGVMLFVLVSSQHWSRWPIVVWPAFAALSTALVLRLASRAPKLSERMLQTIGFSAAIVGGAMTILPSVLDVLNIPIR